MSGALSNNIPIARPTKGKAGGAGKGGVDLSVYLEDFCSSSAKIPAEIKRSFALIHSLDSKVHELKDKVDTDCATYSSAKNKASADMIQHKKDLDENQTRCLQFSEEKVSSAQLCLDLISNKLKELDDTIQEADLKLLTAENQGEEEAEEQPIMPPQGQGGGRDRPQTARDRERERKRKSQGGQTAQLSGWEWLHEGAFVEVEWDKDWWQATVKKIKLKQSGPSGMGPGRMAGQVLVSYVGGDENEDEWIPLASQRLRPPQEDFHTDNQPSVDDLFADPMATPVGARGGGYFGRASF